MDRATQERLVGAVILVVAVVAVVPEILTGPKTPPEPVPAPDSPIRSLEIQLAPPPPAAVAVPEPVAPPPRPQPAPEADASRKPPADPPLATRVEPSPAPPAAATSPAASPEARPGAGAPETDPGAAWAVQLGAFSSQATAEKLVKDLRGRGYPAFIAEYRADGRVLHRVRVGPEQDRKRADALAARLAQDGYPGNVARHP